MSAFAGAGKRTYAFAVWHATCMHVRSAREHLEQQARHLYTQANQIGSNINPQTLRKVTCKSFLTWPAT